MPWAMATPSKLLADVLSTCIKICVSAELTKKARIGKMVSSFRIGTHVLFAVMAKLGKVYLRADYTGSCSGLEL
jgi:hypothetical protein